MTVRSRQGSIVTFYSYKGGTGRSMAVANVGWILASIGKRVLLIDWDLEAPGLHRYFHPFLDDPDLASTPGLIDFFVAFATVARDQPAGADAAWFEPCATLLPYTVPVRWDHFDGGALEIVPAGRQDAGYAVRATSFDWQHFYAHGGGIFIEAIKRQVVADYDYVLIDSRTGISDTSGICTVQMPDQLLAFFTLNRQSINGVAAIAESADRQRRLTDGRPSLTIWPVPTRVELAEKKRLEAAREVARRTFDRFLARMPREHRNDHWNRIEVMYQPYYAYEEVLAAFGDARKTPGSMLSSMEAIASLITHPEAAVLPTMAEKLRRDTLTRFERAKLDAVADTTSAGPRQTVFVSYKNSDGEEVQAIAKELRKEGIDVWMDTLSIPFGEDFAKAHAAAIDAAEVMLYFVAPDDSPSDWREYEVMRALSADKLVVPVLLGGANTAEIPPVLRTRRAAFIRSRENVTELAVGIRSALESRSKTASAPIDPDDPQKGRWGGQARRFGRELRATARELSPGWYEIVLVAAATTGPPIKGSVQFHLHPTFAKPVVVIEAVDGKAELTLTSYGAFTAGAVADEGRTLLELDLSEVEGLPHAFREYR